MGAINTELDYKGFIDADVINVKFNGTLYENLPKRVISETENAYGDLNDSLFPFELHSNTSFVNTLSSRGAFNSIEVSIPSKSEVNVDECFKKAVESVAGFSCTETRTLLTEESVTTTDNDGIILGEFNYSDPITANTIIVTFNGTEYICSKATDGSANNYGATFDLGSEAFDWSKYPFSITSDSGSNLVATQTVGTYSIKIETFESSVETSDCFKRAVRTALPSPLILDINDNDGTLDKTFGEIKDAYLSGRTVLLDPVNPTPILREKSLKSYQLMTELDVDAEGGGEIVFRGKFSNTFQASSDDEYPMLKVEE